VLAHTVALPFSTGRGRVRFHRRVRHVAVEVGLVDDGAESFLALRELPPLAPAPGGGAVFEQVVEDGLVVQAGVRAVELRLDQAQRLVGQVGPLVQHGDQVAVPHHARAGLFRGAGVGVLQLRAVRRRAAESARAASPEE
jgi:hypothetical protein